MGVNNVIPARIAEALRRFPPFSMLPEPAVAALAADSVVRVLAAGEKAWSQGDRPGDELLFLARGRVEYIWKVEERSQLVDVRDVGDVLGLTALLKSEPFRVTAQVVEDSLFYALPWPAMRTLLETHDDARDYARRHLFWATRVGDSISLPEPTESRVTGRAKNILQAHLDGARTIEPRPAGRLLTCTPDETIQSAAERMTAQRVPSILVVDEGRRPIGIVTANMLMQTVVVEGVAKTEPVSRIMTSPVVTVAPHSSATAAMLVMLRQRIGQVCITEDGTAGTAALDVCSHKDLLAQSGHHPAGLLREIRAARTPARFRELCDEIEEIARSYLNAGVSAAFLGQICAELNDELVHRLLDLAAAEMADAGTPLPDRSWAWLSVGSDGRREQILRTDMDNALVFAALGSPETDETARKRFLEFAGKVVERLVACGYARCQGGVMAANRTWCKTDAEWLAEIDLVPESTDSQALLRAVVLYDLRFVAGDKSLCEPLRERIFASVAASDSLQGRLAEQVADTPPPLNFFGRFVVETQGSGAGEFDIKNRAMAPLRDAARLLTLRHRLNRRYSTFGRWDEIRRAVPQHQELATLARDGYDLLLRLRNLNGLRRGDSGRYIDPSDLTKLERAQLANVFDVVRMVQDAVRGDFNIPSRL
jgi:CBS domain-containing protein